MIHRILELINQSTGLYHRLVLVVGHSGSGKTETLRSVAETIGSQVVNVNLELSMKLLELTAKQRAIKLPELLDQIVCGAQGPVVLDNLEILFDTALKQDPLRLLQGLSRNRTVVAAWNGKYFGGRLLYAEPGHHEYRSYDSIDALIEDIAGTASINLVINNKEAGQA